jgi:hypothetical protein
MGVDSKNHIFAPGLSPGCQKSIALPEALDETTYPFYQSGVAPSGLTSDFIAASFSVKYHLSAKITAHVKLPATSQGNCAAIFIANWIQDF